jgi:hypothetical protein
MSTGDFVIYRVPQPLGRTGLVLSVTCASGDCNSSNPDIYVSERLPRNVYDFRTAQASDQKAETITLNKQSSTGRYWVAIYANGPAMYKVKTSRVVISGGPTLLTEQTFIQAVTLWLTTTVLGQSVLAICSLVFTCICCVCFFI